MTTGPCAEAVPLDDGEAVADDGSPIKDAPTPASEAFLRKERRDSFRRSDMDGYRACAMDGNSDSQCIARPDKCEASRSARPSKEAVNKEKRAPPKRGSLIYAATADPMCYEGIPSGSRRVDEMPAVAARLSVAWVMHSASSAWASARARARHAHRPMVSLQRSSQRVIAPRRRAQPFLGCAVWRFDECTQAIDNMSSAA